MNPKYKIQNPKSLTPLDRTALALMLVLAMLMALLAASGDRTLPRVRDFSWQDKQVGAEDNRFTLTFNRPMNQASVEANLHIEPPLPEKGKVSWAGRRMVYTLKTPAFYETSYKVELQGARDSFAPKQDSPGKLMEPFAGSFQTRDRAFVYQGVEGEELGRLILYNFTKKQKTILTPRDLVVLDFKPFPANDRILFSATDALSQSKGLQEQKLYTVTTGINLQRPSDPEQNNGLIPSSLFSFQPREFPAGRINLILDNKDYQNLKFDISADGQTTVVQRMNRQNPGQFGLWVLKLEQNPDVLPTAQPLENQPGGEFLITPDSTSVALTQGQGVAILPLLPKAKPVDFLPKYGMVLSFARDNSVGAMVKFNTDNPQQPTRSLFLVPNQSIKPGEDKELLRTTGSILGCQFDPSAENLYCLLTKLLPGELYQEQPYLAAIDLKTAKSVPLLIFPNQRDIQMSLSPDGLALLFDQLIPSQTPGASALRTSDGQAIATSRLWMLPLQLLAAGKVQPEQLPLPGLHPRWLP